MLPGDAQSQGRLWRTRQEMGRAEAKRQKNAAEARQRLSDQISYQVGGADYRAAKDRQFASRAKLSSSSANAARGGTKGSAAYANPLFKSGGRVSTTTVSKAKPKPPPVVPVGGPGWRRTSDGRGWIAPDAESRRQPAAVFTEEAQRLGRARLKREAQQKLNAAYKAVNAMTRDQQTQWERTGSITLLPGQQSHKIHAAINAMDVIAKHRNYKAGQRSAASAGNVAARQGGTQGSAAYANPLFTGGGKIVTTTVSKPKPKPAPVAVITEGMRDRDGRKLNPRTGLPYPTWNPNAPITAGSKPSGGSALKLWMQRYGGNNRSKPLYPGMTFTPEAIEHIKTHGLPVGQTFDSMYMKHLAAMPKYGLSGKSSSGKKTGNYANPGFSSGGGSSGGGGGYTSLGPGNKPRSGGVERGGTGAATLRHVPTTAGSLALLTKAFDAGAISRPPAGIRRPVSTAIDLVPGIGGGAVKPAGGGKLTAEQKARAAAEGRPYSGVDFLRLDTSGAGGMAAAIKRVRTTGDSRIPALKVQSPHAGAAAGAILRPTLAAATVAPLAALAAYKSERPTGPALGATTFTLPTYRPPPARTPTAREYFETPGAVRPVAERIASGGAPVPAALAPPAAVPTTDGPATAGAGAPRVDPATRPLHALDLMGIDYSGAGGMAHAEKQAKYEKALAKHKKEKASLDTALRNWERELDSQPRRLPASAALPPIQGPGLVQGPALPGTAAAGALDALNRPRLPSMAELRDYGRPPESLAPVTLLGYKAQTPPDYHKFAREQREADALARKHLWPREQVERGLRSPPPPPGSAQFALNPAGSIGAHLLHWLEPAGRTITEIPTSLGLFGDYRKDHYSPSAEGAIFGGLGTTVASIVKERRLPTVADWASMTSPIVRQWKDDKGAVVASSAGSAAILAIPPVRAAVGAARTVGALGRFVSSIAPHVDNLPFRVALGSPTHAAVHASPRIRKASTITITNPEAGVDKFTGLPVSPAMGDGYLTVQAGKALTIGGHALITRQVDLRIGGRFGKTQWRLGAHDPALTPRAGHGAGGDAPIGGVAGGPRRAGEDLTSGPFRIRIRIQEQRAVPAAPGKDGANVGKGRRQDSQGPHPVHRARAGRHGKGDGHTARHVQGV